MKKLINLLQYFSISLSLISLFFIVFSLKTLLDFDNCISFAKSISNIYKALSTYSGIYNFTFIVCAFWATLRQLEISKNNYDTTSSQIQFVQDDIVDKRDKDIKDETLKQCNLYFGEIQKEYKEIMEAEKINGMPLNWQNLDSITNKSLREKYSNLSQQIDEIDRKIKNNILLTLYKYEAFSAIFLHGNLDKELAKNIIGETFSRQVGLLIGIIAYFREDEKSIFGINTIKLYNDWKKE
jgi:hypothetical protein